MVDLRARFPPHVFDGHFGKIYSLSLNRDGTLLASAAQDCSIIIWETALNKVKHSNYRRIQLISLASAWVMACCFHPDGTRIFSGGLDNTVSMYDIDTGTLLKEFQGLYGYVASIIARESRVFASSGDGSVIIWDIATAAIVNRINAGANDLIGMALNCAEDRLFAGSVVSSVKGTVFDLQLNPALTPNYSGDVKFRVFNANMTDGDCNSMCFGYDATSKESTLIAAFDGGVIRQSSLEKDAAEISYTLQSATGDRQIILS
jgi:WD40 repeat protein